MKQGPWAEVGDGVFVRRYPFFTQDIGAIMTADGPLIVDTRSTPSQAREILDDLRALTAQPVAAVVNTHHHFDHSFGNHQFRPAPIWGHLRCAERVRAMQPADLAELARSVPEIAADVGEVVFDAPDRTFGDEGADVEIGGRRIELRWVGRGHTDNDIVVVVPDAGVVFAGDLLENGDPPYFGDGYPLDWPATATALRRLVVGPVVPGHGDVGDLAFVDRSIQELQAIADLARSVHAGALDLPAAIAAAPYAARQAREPLERALAQLRGELD